MQPSLWWALSALFPLLTRGILVLAFPSHANDILTRTQLAPEAHRSFILTLAGFSFTGLIAIAVLDKALRQSFALATLFLLISFLSFLSALNLQAYKLKRWQDDLATAITESETLSMVLAVVAILFTGTLAHGATLTISGIGILIWLLDHVVRIRFDWRYLKEVARGN